MFDSLRKKLKDSAKKLTEKVSREEPEKKPKKEKAKKEKKPVKKVKPAKKEKARKEAPKEVPKVEEAPEEVPEEEIQEEVEEKKERKGFLKRVRERVTEKELSGEDIEDFFKDLEMDLLQSNVAFEVGEALKKGLKEKLAGRPIKRTKAGETIREAFKETLLEIVDQGRIDLPKMAKEKPICVVFLGFNGSGKTTSIAKVARYMMDKGLKPVLAAGDTFRAASIEQLEHHGEKLGLKVIKHQYGSDAAAVVFDARKYMEGNKLNIVLADTAGRSHADKNLMDELTKVVRVNKPDLKLLVGDSLTGNDAVEQARKFHEAVGVDGVLMTKIDVNKKGGAVLSVAWAIKKPILFFGTGQEYQDLEAFKPEKFVKELI